jgi:[CysO sulfur-carrier protein]-S-L-cysteine hydrolase
VIVSVKHEQVLRMAAELERAGRREIGGVLVGRHVEGERFALVDFSVQRRGGGRSHFRRDPKSAALFVSAQIAAAGGDPTVVNYMGEWHSHTSAPALPSAVDVSQMRQIVDDPLQSCRFSVLMVVQLVPDCLEMSLTLFRPRTAEESVVIEVEGAVVGAVGVADVGMVPAVGPETEQLDA